MHRLVAFAIDVTALMAEFDNRRKFLSVHQRVEFSCDCVSVRRSKFHIPHYRIANAILHSKFAVSAYRYLHLSFHFRFFLFCVLYHANTIR